MKEEVFNLKLAAKENESLTTQLASLKGIVAASVNNMTVALGGSKEEGLEAKDTATLVALHDSTLKRTMESFKTGGISAMSTEADDEKPVVGRFEARLKAVTGTKTK